MVGRRRHRSTRLGAPLCLLGLTLATTVLAQSATTLRVTREEATMVITNRGLGAEGARSYFNHPCEEELLSTIFYGPPDEVEMVIDGETRLQSSAAIIRRERGSGDEQGQETIEMLDGELTFAGRPACIESFVPAEPQSVRLEQGRTNVVGTRFFLDRETDVAQMEGPIDLRRAPSEDAELLEATADALEYHLETQRSTLTGGVRVVAGERISEAERLELDEEAGLATLTGDPARSRNGENVIEGRTLLYYLDSNDVVVVGAVRGTLEIDLD